MRDGILKLTTAPGKDRRSWLPPTYRIHVAVNPALSLSITEQGDDEAGPGQGPPPGQAKILAVLGADFAKPPAQGNLSRAIWQAGLDRRCRCSTVSH